MRLFSNIQYQNVPKAIQLLGKNTLENRLLGDMSGRVKEYFTSTIKNGYYFQSDNPKWVMSCYKFYLCLLDNKLIRESQEIASYLIDLLLNSKCASDFYLFFENNETYFETLINLLIQSSHTLMENKVIFESDRYYETIKKNIITAEKMISLCSESIEMKPKLIAAFNQKLLECQAAYLYNTDNPIEAKKLVLLIEKNISPSSELDNFIYRSILYVSCCMSIKNHKAALERLTTIEAYEEKMESDDSLLYNTYALRHHYSGICHFLSGDYKKAAFDLESSCNHYLSHASRSEKEVHPSWINYFLIAVILIDSDPKSPQGIELLKQIHKKLSDTDADYVNTIKNILLHYFDIALIVKLCDQSEHIKNIITHCISDREFASTENAADLNLSIRPRRR